MTKRIERATEMAAILSGPLRLGILEQLRAGPRIVGDLVEALGEGQAAVSKQLAILKEAGLLACRPEGRCREYRLADPERVGRMIDELTALADVAEANAARCRARRAVQAQP